MVRAFAKAKDIFFSPSLFYRRVKNEKRVGPIVVDLFMIMFIPALIWLLLIVSAYFGALTDSVAAFIMGFIISMFMFIPIILGFTLLFMAFRAFFLFLALKVAQVDRGYYQCFKITTYNYFVYIFYFVLFFLVILIGLLFGLEDVYSMLITALLWFSMYMLVSLLSFIHYVIAKVKGIAIIHEISGWKAFGVLILAGIFELVFMFLIAAALVPFALLV